MGQFSRRLFALAAAAPGVLCVGVCVLWVRSYWWADGVAVSSPGSRYVRASSDWGRFQVAVVDPQIISGRWSGPEYGCWPHPGPFDAKRPGVRSDWHLLGFRWLAADAATVWVTGSLIVDHNAETVVAVPHWFLAATLAVAPG